MYLVKIIISLYCIVALGLALSFLVFNYKTLSKLNWYETLILFLVSPLVLIRELIKGKR